MASSLPVAFRHPYVIDPAFKKSVAYFSMEFAIDQALKTYSGGLGFLAGSHMKSAFDLKQNLIGIGMLWKQGKPTGGTKQTICATCHAKGEYVPLGI